MATALVGVPAGPLIDHAQGMAGAALLLVAGLAVGLPAWFFVFGLEKSQLVGLWMLEPDLLKRQGAWLLGVVSVATVYQFIFMIAAH